jgi:putative endonuclease
MPSGFVYILASEPHGTLYIGITSNLHERMEQHRCGTGSAFVKKYGVKRLVYFEEYPLYADAIRRETNLKRWKRQWKIDLIEKHNPRWFDLIENWHR